MLLEATGLKEHIARKLIFYYFSIQYEDSVVGTVGSWV